MSAMQKVVFAALEAHRRDPDQTGVWLPMVRCVCGDVMPSNRLRAHMAEQIADAVTAAPTGMVGACGSETHTAACRDAHERAPLTDLVADASETVTIAVSFAPPSGHGRELLEQAADLLEQAGRELEAAS